MNGIWWSWASFYSGENGRGWIVLGFIELRDELAFSSK